MKGQTFSLALFQSTHSLRSATFWLLLALNCSTWFQSTHSLRSATYAARKAFNVDAVSIHALLAECDPLKLSIVEI